MDVRSLKYFTAVFEEESLSGAARRCFVAQPSISTTLAQLEEQLGVRLFLRHRKGVTPTPEARKFYAVANQLLGEFNALKDLFKQEDELLPLSIAIMPTIDARRMGEFLGSLIDHADNVLLRLVDMHERADARIVSDRLRRKDERFLHLWDEKYVLALPHGHRLTLQNSVALNDLHGERFIERCLCELQDDVAALLKKSRIKPLTVARATNEEWAAALVAAGVGVSIVPESSVREMERVVTRPIQGLKLVRKVGLAYDPTVSMPASLRSVLAQLGVRATRARKVS